MCAMSTVAANGIRYRLACWSRAAALCLVLWLGAALPTTVSADELGDCGAPGSASIAEIRSGGATAPAEGDMVVVEAIVSASFMGPDQLRGFFLYADQPSAGIFVYAPDWSATRTPRAGDRWRLVAEVGRYRGRIQLQSPKDWRHCGFGTVTPAVLAVNNVAAYDRLDDRLVTLDRTVVLADLYDLGRFGSLRLAINQRAFVAANGVDGGQLLPLLLDDGSYRRNPRPVPYLDQDGVRRSGDRLESVTGILTRAFGEWRIHPVQAPVLTTANPRPDPLPPAEGLRVMQLNLRNYFIDPGARGAPTQAALERQQARLQQLFGLLDADVLVLHEIQNREAAVQSLLTLLNDGKPSQQHYHSSVANRRSAAIRSVILYRPSAVTLTQASTVPDSAHPRDPVVSQFRLSDGRMLQVVAAHFKSRGGCPEAGDVDRGEGCWAQRRHGESRQLIGWLDDQAIQSGGQLPTLVLADFNAYAEETALQAWQQSGFIDLIARYVPPSQRYTYVYRGAAGYLDHAVSTSDVEAMIERVSIWPINADEPAYLGDVGEAIWRVSDHDPIVIDFKP